MRSQAHNSARVLLKILNSYEVFCRSPRRSGAESVFSPGQEILPLLRNTWSHNSGILPARVRHIAGVEVVLLLNDLSFFIHREAVGNA